MAINVLSIGNSFSQDAQKYLHYLAKSEGVDIQNANLYIGGCPLDKHFRNMMGDKKDYDLEINGNPTGFKMTISEALLARNWDYITLQQASNFSFKYETYTPYINELAEYIRELCPKAKILIHQTWGYESYSDRIKNFGFETYDDMFAMIKESYDNAAKEIDADGIIPCGEVLQAAQKNGMAKVHRDGFHAGKGAGRFMLALTWYKYITGNSIDNVKFKDFEFDGNPVEVTEEEYKIAIKSVNDIL